MAATIIIGQKNSSLIDPSQHTTNDGENWQVSTWPHRACLAMGCTTLFISLAKSVSLVTCKSGGPTTTTRWFLLLLAVFLGYVASDLATGIYHWAVDNYGCPQTPIFGSQIESFQGHHQQPWAITKRDLANNLYIPAASITAAVSPINILSTDPFLLGFVGVFAGCIMFSQLFHAWAHTPKRKLPPVVVALQDAGILVGRAPHAAHHRPPYNSNYCIVSGIWDRFLDGSRFFVGLEVAVFKMLGVRPRSWNDPISLRSD